MFDFLKSSGPREFTPLNFDIDLNINGLFPTAILEVPPTEESSKYLDIAAIEKALLNDRENKEGIARSNAGGWHSDDSYLWKEEHLRPLYKYTHLALEKGLDALAYDMEKYTVVLGNSWSIINKPGDYNYQHHHPGSDFSTVFYVKVPPNSGQLRLIDPRPNNIFNSLRKFSKEGEEKFTDSVFDIEPKEGLLLAFPAWLEHSVTRNDTDEDRIIISTNWSIIERENA